MPRRNRDDMPVSTESVDFEELEKIDSYIREGLIQPGWKPLGSTVRERLGSIEAKAYTTWLRANAMHLPIAHPQFIRSLFLRRKEDGIPKFPEPDRSAFEAAMVEQRERDRKSMEYEQARMRLYDESRAKGYTSAVPVHLGMSPLSAILAGKAPPTREDVLPTGDRGDAWEPGKD